MARFVKEEPNNHAGKTVETVLYYYHKGITDADLSALGIKPIHVPQNGGRIGMEAYLEGIKEGRSRRQIAAELKAAEEAESKRKTKQK
jgi:hypothetical protein